MINCLLNKLQNDCNDVVLWQTQSLRQYDVGAVCLFDPVKKHKI